MTREVLKIRVVVQKIDTREVFVNVEEKPTYDQVVRSADLLWRRAGDSLAVVQYDVLGIEETVPA